MTKAKKCVTWKFDSNGSFYITKHIYPLEIVTPVQLTITNNSGDIEDKAHLFNNRVERLIDTIKIKLNVKTKRLLLKLILKDLDELNKITNDKLEIEHEDRLDELILFIEDYCDISLQ
jgi:hypothetical protein